MAELRPRALHLELSAYPEDAIERLESVVELTDGEALDAGAVPAALAEGRYTVLFVRLGITLTADDVAAAPDLRLVVTPTTGLDHLDVDGLRERGIRVISLRDARTAITSVHATAEHTFALLLACVRRLPQAHQDVAAGNWRRTAFLGTELAGRTLGIIGHGRLGRRVAGYGAAFGMTVIVHDQDPEALIDLPPGVTAAPWEAVLAGSDVVSLHLPLNDGTRHWLDASRISMLRDGAIVVNTARGELIDEVALSEALESRRLGGVAVDVVADDASWGERVGVSPLLDLVGTDANLIVTPHIGGWARDAVAATRRIVSELAVRAMGDPAEGGGFEPPRAVKPNTDSSRAP